MRLDKYLKVSRLIKRRTVANEACDAGRVLVNDKPAKASVQVKTGDTIEIQFGSKNVKVEVLDVKETVKKEDVERVIGLYNEEQGKNISDDWYTCFDIMKLYGLGKTQVRRFAETHGVRIRKFKGGRANYYLKADWEAARKKAEKSSTTTKAKRK